MRVPRRSATGAPRASVLAFARGVIGASVGRRVLVGLESDGVRSAGWLDWQLGSPRAASEVWSVLEHPDEADMAAAEGLFGELGATALAMLHPDDALLASSWPRRGSAIGLRGDTRWSKAEWSEASRAVSAASGAPIRFATFGRSDDPGYVAECARSAGIVALFGPRIGWVGEAQTLATVPVGSATSPELVRRAVAGSRRAMATLALRARLGA